ncbi:MAG: exo-alpha-sialidase, partial [Thermoguttaceae bacterium]|nr:exo-alpha-sialidase [Thermoguttaceae bacterium]
MKNSHITRRDLLKSAGAAALFGAGFVSSSLRAAEAPRVEILSEKAVTETPDLYYGWPTVGVTQDDELLVAVSGGRETHVCPFGRVDLFRSRDKGETWTWPQTISDGPIDDRDAGILVTDKGTILVTTFTSLAYSDEILSKEIERRAKGEKEMSDQRYDRWMGVHNRVSEPERIRE